jgi:hypothetical protein
MVPKVTTSESSACFEYDLRKKHADDQPGLWVGGTVFGSAREMAKQIAFFRKLRPDCKRPIISFSLSLPPNDGRPRPQKWERMVKRFLEKMGIDIKTHGWAAHEHIHENSHVHIRVCRISSIGKLWNQENSAKRAIKVCAELEEEFQLEKHDRTPASKKRPTMAEIQISKRKGIPMPRVFIQKKVDLAIKNYPRLHFQELQKLLITDLIDMQPYAPNGVLIGVSYLYDGIKWPGSKIGRAYSAGLTERGVIFTTDASAEPKVQEEQTSKSLPKPTSSKMPTALKPILFPEQYGVKQIKLHSAHQTEVMDTPTFDLKPIATLPTGSLSKGMAMAGFACINLTLAAFRAVLNLIAAILRKFGFNIKVAEAQPNSSASHQLPLYYSTTQQALPAPTAEHAEHQAATEIFRVVSAVENNSPTDLPVVKGTELEREQAFSALTNNDQFTGKAAVADADLPPNDFGYTGEDFSSTPTTQAPATDPLDDLKAAIAACEAAIEAVAAAERDRPGMPIYFDTRDDRRKDVELVQIDLVKARQDLQEWRAANPLKARFGSKFRNELYAAVENLEAHEKLVIQDLADAETTDDRAEKFYRSLPKGVVPAATMAALASSRKAVKFLREAIQLEAESLLNQLKVDPMLGRQLAEIRRQVESNYKNYLSTQIVSKSYFQSLSAQIRELRKLAAQAAGGGGGGNGDHDLHKPEEEKFA